MSETRECNSAVTAGRLLKAVEFFDAAEHLEEDMPNAAGDLFDSHPLSFGAEVSPPRPPELSPKS